MATSLPWTSSSLPHRLIDEVFDRSIRNQRGENNACAARQADCQAVVAAVFHDAMSGKSAT
eukprot:4904889-Pyramimonas_sp.AAC.1